MSARMPGQACRRCADPVRNRAPRFGCQSRQERDVRRRGWSVAAQADSAWPSSTVPGHRCGYVAILGRPNAGKSTLLNALLGQKISIVSAKVQTTRQSVLGILSENDFQMILLDTPGIILEERNELEKKMMASVRRSVRDADALVAIVDVAHAHESALDMIQLPANYQGPPLLVALNKCDLVDDVKLAEAQVWWKERCRADACLPLSALSGQGVQEVQDWMVSKLPAGPALYPADEIAQQPQRFFVAEIMREHVYRQYRQEIPYVVQVGTYDARKRGKDYIQVDLICEKDSQKGVLLGKGGSAIKALASAARVDIEDFVEKGVFLDVKVKVEKNWRKNADKLKQYGF